MKRLAILLALALAFVAPASGSDAEDGDGAEDPCDGAFLCAGDCSHEFSICVRVYTCAATDVGAEGYPVCVIVTGGSRMATWVG